MKKLLVVVGFAFSLQALAQDRFPTSPDPTLTPGSLCAAPSTFRYPEKIPYCDRNVRSSLKVTIIQTYDSELGFQISTMERKQFKIDHYIPLCMGGSNEATNLWPQNESVYTITDSLEQLSCQRMAEGKLLQKDAVDLIKRAKLNLEEAPKVLDYLKSL